MDNQVPIYEKPPPYSPSEQPINNFGNYTKIIFSF